MKHTEESYDVIKDYIHLLRIEFPTNKWEGDNILIFSKGKEEIGKLKFDDKTVEVEGATIVKAFKELIDKKKAIEAEKITAETVKDTPFSKMFAEQNLKSFYNIEKNPGVFKWFLKVFKKLNIGDIVTLKPLSTANSIYPIITMAIDCTTSDNNTEDYSDGHIDRIRASLLKVYKDHRIKTTSNISFYTAHYPSKMDKKEEAIEIKVHNTLIGYYYKERNLIFMAVNPFQFVNGKILDEDPGLFATDFIDSLIEMKLEVQDTTKLKERIFIASFLKNTKASIKESESNMKAYSDNVKSHEENIRNYIERIQEESEKLKWYEDTLETGGKNIFKEIEAVKSLPFIEKVGTEGDKIFICFKPATLVFNNFRRSFAKEFKTRTCYLGNITFEISPSSFKLKNDTPLLCRNPHTHSSTDGSPCFGSGDGRNKIYEMLGQNKFSELAKMLWFWIKTHREDGSYVKMGTFYDDRLQQGLPVWDEDGKLIELNDPERLSACEQIKLSKSDKYDENKKKFAGVSMF